jgi:hypothetical protein
MKYIVSYITHNNKEFKNTVILNNKKGADKLAQNLRKLDHVSDVNVIKEE